MTYATNRERFSMIQNSTFDNPCPFVVRFEKEGRESELIADDIDHALNIQKHWIDRGANYVEIFRDQGIYQFDFVGLENPFLSPHLHTIITSLLSIANDYRR